MTTKLLDAKGNPPTIRRGTSPTLTFNVVVEGTANPKNLNGATEVTFAIAASSNATARDLTLTLGNGVEHNGTGGVVTVTLTTPQTEALPVGTNGRRWCELWLTDSAGRRDLVAAGECFVRDTLITVP